MRKIALALAFVLAVGAAEAQIVSEMTPAMVKQALSDKKAPGCYEIKRGTSAWSWGGPVVGCFTTPYSRVVGQKAYREKRYQKMTESDVTPDLVAAGEAHVYAYPLTQGNKVNSVVAVVIGPHKSKGADGVIQPTSSEEISTEYKNLLGATFEGKGVRAVFPLAALSEKHEFRVVFENGEEKSKIKVSDVR